MFFNAIAGNTMFSPASQPISTEKGLFEKPEEMADSDKNNSQSGVPYLAELRRLRQAAEEEAANNKQPAEDPLGRGAVLDFCA